MFILDSLLAAPLHGLLWVARKIRQQAEQELADDEQDIRARLAELNRQLETGAIDEPSFQQQEARLLDRLDRLWAKDPLRSLPPPGHPTTQQEHLTQGGPHD